jgi:hypothetical protein
MNGVTKLFRFDLPGGAVFLNDGGITTWGGNTYRATHPVLGGIAQVSELSFGFGPELPECEFVFAPPSNGALAPLQSGAFLRVGVRYWIADFNPSTGAVVGTPHLEFAGRMDRVRQTHGFRQLGIVVSCVPETEVLLFSDDGNGLSPEFHKSVYPGETGHDQATGLVIPVAWGVAGGAQNGSGGSGGSGSGFGGFGGGFEGRTDAL